MTKNLPKLKACMLILCILFLKNTQAQNNCLNFDGANDVINMPYNVALDFSITDEFTIEAWIKTNSSYAPIFSNQLSNPPYNGYEVAIHNGKLSFELVNNDQSNKMQVVTLLSCNDGSWHHVACVYRGIPTASAVGLYIDGQSLTTNALSNNLSGIVNSIDGTYIGFNFPLFNNFSGNIDEIRVWDKALCAQSITTCMNSNLTGTEANLVAYYNFNQGIAGGNNTSTSVLNDLGPNSINGSLISFALNGSTSNWLTATNGINGTCTPFTVDVYASGPGQICTGESANILAIGASSYTWMPGNLQGSVISVTPVISTIYTVTGEVSGCTGKTTYSLDVDACVGLAQKLSATNEVQVFPNPFTGSFTIKGLAQTSKIYIYNLLGEMVYKNIIVGTEHEIFLPDVPKGTYFLEIISEKTTREIILKE
jgi:hypothetical protein